MVAVTDTLLFGNNVSAALNNSVVDSDLSLVVATGTGGVFPSPAAGQYFAVTLHNTSNGDVEVCYCTGRSGDILTVERAREGTTALAFPSASTVLQMRVTKGILEKLLQVRFSAADATKYLQVQASGLVSAVPPEFAVPAGISFLANNETHTAGKATAPVTINAASGGTVTLDCALSNTFVVNLQSNITLDVSNFLDGQTLNVVLAQDATGGRTVAWAASKFKWPDANVPTVTATASAIDMLACRRYGAGTRMLSTLAQNFG